MNLSVSGTEQQLVVFTLASESYGVDIAKVSGIERMHDITTVPRTPSFVQGVINLRGRVIPVVHLRKLFNLSEGEITKETRIVVVDIGGQQIGVQVDEVTEVLTISTESIEPASSIITSADSDFMLGIAKLDDKLVILLDLEKVLSNQESTQLSDMATDDEPASEVAESSADVEVKTEEVPAAFEEELTQELEAAPKAKPKAKKTKRKKTV